MKCPYIVYWWSNSTTKKWQPCSTLDKAIRVKSNLEKQKIYKVWIAKDL